MLRFTGRHRWVEYGDKGRYNASQVPAEWHGWLHFITDHTGDEVSFFNPIMIASMIEELISVFFHPNIDCWQDWKTDLFWFTYICWAFYFYFLSYSSMGSVQPTFVSLIACLFQHISRFTRDARLQTCMMFSPWLRGCPFTLGNIRKITHWANSL